MDTDTWGKPLGADESPAKSPQLSSKVIKSNMGLVYHFKESIPFKLDGTVNALALTKNFKSLRENGVSYENIHKMIDRFFYEINENPLPANVETWAAFIKRREQLLQWVTTNAPDSDVSEWK